MQEATVREKLNRAEAQSAQMQAQLETLKAEEEIDAARENQLEDQRQKAFREWINESLRASKVLGETMQLHQNRLRGLKLNLGAYQELTKTNTTSIQNCGTENTSEQDNTSKSANGSIAEKKGLNKQTLDVCEKKQNSHL